MRLQESKSGLVNYFIFFVVRKAFDFNFLFTDTKIAVRKRVPSLPAEQWNTLSQLCVTCSLWLGQPGFEPSGWPTERSRTVHECLFICYSSALLSRIHTRLFWCRELQFKGTPGMQDSPQCLLFGQSGLSIADDTPICSLAFLVSKLACETKTSSHNHPSLAPGLGSP